MCIDIHKYIYIVVTGQIEGFLDPENEELRCRKTVEESSPCLWQSAHYLHAEYRQDQIIETFDPYTKC